MVRRLLLASAWTALILILCWIPHQYAPRERDFRAVLAIRPDKLVHVVLFAGFGVLWLRVRDAPGWTAWVLASGVLLTVVSELGQMLPMVNRDATWPDALADLAGLLVSLVAIRLLRPSGRKSPTAAA